MELEQELVAALRALELNEVPEDMVTSLFNTGGTAVLTADEAAEGADALFPDFVESVTVGQLRSVDCALTKYLRKHLAASAETDQMPRPNERLSSDYALLMVPEVAQLWEFFASEDAITAVVGNENERAHSIAVYRTFFTLLQGTINIRDVYSKLDEEDKRRALVKALLASKVYLTWLQIPGGSAYGIFMPYVYRQVLDVLKKWVALVRADAIAANSGATASRRVSVRQRTLKQKQKAAKRKGKQQESEEDISELQQKMNKFGLDLFEMMATFLGNFSLASSTESIIPTIEMVIHLQNTVLDDDVGSAVTGKSLKVVSSLLNGIHGSMVQIARVIVHCYVPGVVMQESLAIENRCALRFHKLAIEVISRAERIIYASAGDDNEEREEIQHQGSLLKLGLLQNICLKAPERSEERQRVLSLLWN
uniref:Uncharacterized protein n=1 Tax=Globisporangium ultimum (strain ATCC 200006 / CBS 805.95 / DAOM BR144) TaxID=431595 RepID=K3W9Y2_GLOUD